jgi:hypothetical protein
MSRRAPVRDTIDLLQGTLDLLILIGFALEAMPEDV